MATLFEGKPQYNNGLFSAVVCHTLSGNGVYTEVSGMVHFDIPMFQWFSLVAIFDLHGSQHIACRHTSTLFYHSLPCPSRFAFRIPNQPSDVITAWATDCTVWCEGQLLKSNLLCWNTLPCVLCWQLCVGMRQSSHVLPSWSAVPYSTVGNDSLWWLFAI